MCGICGVMYFDGRPVERSEIERMNAMIVHRGPDSGGVFIDGSVGLGNRRLAILDPTAGADLPMISSDGRFALAYNGEIYNHPDLRATLEAQGVRFRTGSDAETVIETVRDAPESLVTLYGMFALGMWDTHRRILLLARDIMGEKPLYYYHGTDILVFGSEIKALLTHPAVPRESAFEGAAERLALYLGFGYTPAPATAFKDIWMLPPGHMLIAGERGVSVTRYNAPMASYGQWRYKPLKNSDFILNALETTVKETLISDVPLGAFLSGGLDSSLVAALMRRSTNAAIKTFSIGFAGDDSFDETPWAERAARHIGTEHTAFIVEPDALDLLPKLVWHHDQPFADSSAIPTYLVSKLTREHVTVALTGDGGDEVFAGYERFYAAQLIDRLRVMPRPLWQAAANMLSIIPEGTGYYNLAKRARRFAYGALLPPALAYFDFVRVFNADQIRALTGEPDAAGSMFSPLVTHLTGQPPSLDDLLYANMTTYLPDDLLIKTDRSSMAASLELRAPFLNSRVISAATLLRPDMKLRGGTTKWILKQAARGLLPDDLIDRPKHGFGVPLGAWLRRDMSLVRDLLLSREARGRGLLHTPAVERLITEHANGTRDHAGRLWALLTLESWHRQFIDPATFGPENIL